MAERNQPSQAAEPVRPVGYTLAVSSDDDPCRFFGLGTRCAWLTGRGAAGEEQRFLTRPYPLRVPAERFYNPLEVPGIAYQFSNVEATEGGFLSFAREFGFLGVASALLGDAQDLIGESLDEWIAAHAAVQTGIRLLRRFEANPDDDEVTTELRSMINAQLKFGAQTRVAWSRPREKHQVMVYPTTLLGAIWWELARVFTGEVSYARCLVCSRYMERGPRDSGVGVRQVNAMFCSPACRQRDHRLRVRAKDMAARGDGVNAIAERLNVDIGTVDRWLVSHS